MSDWGLFEGTQWDAADSENTGAVTPVDYIAVEKQKHYFKKLSAEMASLEALNARCADPACDDETVRHELASLLDGNIGMFLFHLGYPVEELEEVARTEPAVESAILFVMQTLRQMLDELTPHLRE